MVLHWHTEPFLLLALLFFGWAYALAVGPFRARLAPPGTPFSPARAASWYLALLLAYLAVGSPLDQIAEEFLFSAHMLQHMILVYPVVFCLLWGLPSWLADLLLRPAPVRAAARLLFHPAVGGLAFTLTYTLWHIPSLYEAALHSKPVHILEHFTMFLTGAMMLGGFASPSRLLPGPGYGIRMLTVFLLMVGQLPVFAFLSFADSVHYETYAWAPRIIPGFSALEDQILGGVLMKISNMAVSLALFGYCFYAWARRDADARDQPFARLRTPPSPALPSLP